MSALTKATREAFGARLEKAATHHADCPAKNQGRLEWLAKKMQEKGESVSNESVRKWLSGEALPRYERVVKLAELLQVDADWLHSGQDARLDLRERRARNATADGAVNVVAGMIQMDGGYPAFPEGGDTNVDLHAILRGAKYDIHVTVGQVEGRDVTFHIPTGAEDLFVLGLVRDGFAFDVFEITSEMIAAGKRRSGSIEIQLDGRELKRIETFSKRL